MKTRFKELDIRRFGDTWRFVTTEDNKTVGPLYKSKSEILADIDRYGKEYLGLDRHYDLDTLVLVDRIKNESAFREWAIYAVSSGEELLTLAKSLNGILAAIQHGTFHPVSGAIEELNKKAVAVIMKWEGL